jgi:hypothetical protein
MKITFFKVFKLFTFHNPSHLLSYLEK